LDVLTLEIGMLGQQLFRRRAGRKLPDDIRDSDPHSSDARPPTTPGVDVIRSNSSFRTFRR
jgi:hypothetical protein